MEPNLKIRVENNFSDFGGKNSSVCKIYLYQITKNTPNKRKLSHPQAGELLYCRKRSDTKCCFSNFTCVVSWNDINIKFELPAISFLNETVSIFLQTNLHVWCPGVGPLPAFCLFFTHSAQNSIHFNGFYQQNKVCPSPRRNQTHTTLESSKY